MTHPSSPPPSALKAGLEDVVAGTSAIFFGAGWALMLDYIHCGEGRAARQLVEDLWDPTIRGKAESEAIRIYAGSMNADPEFYEFVRTLEAYKKAFPAGTKMILSTDNRFLDLMRKR